MPDFAYIEVILQRLTDATTVQLWIEGSVLKDNHVLVFLKTPNCEGKESIPRNFGLVDNKALAFCFKPLMEIIEEGADMGVTRQPSFSKRLK